MTEQLTDSDIDFIIADLQRAITQISGNIQVLKSKKSNYIPPVPLNMRLEKAAQLYHKGSKTMRRKNESREIDSWENWDNRVACPQFDFCEVGCLYCDHYDMVMDTQSLSCPLEMDLNRKKIIDPDINKEFDIACRWCDHPINLLTKKRNDGNWYICLNKDTDCGMFFVKNLNDSTERISEKR